MKKSIKNLILIFTALYMHSVHAQSVVTVNPDQTISVNGSKLFPISVYIQSDWAGAKSLGINTASRPFCVNNDAFRKGESNGLYLHYTAGPACDYENAAAIRRRDASGFISSINQVKGSDFLFGYGLPDEPVSATNLSPADTKWAYDVIKAADPNHPVFLTDYARDISEYKNSADIFLNDQYPFNNDRNPLYDIKEKLKLMQSQVAPKPVWLIIQTGSQFGMPTNAQIRAETYLSIALGSTGLIFYSYDVEDAGGVHNIKKDGDPAFLKNLIAELKQLSPVFLGSKNPNLAYSSSNVDAILKNYNGKSYLVAVNKSPSAQTITFSLNGFGNATATLVGLSSAGSTRAGQTRAVASGALTDVLQGLEAVIYEIGPSQPVATPTPLPTATPTPKPTATPTPKPTPVPTPKPTAIPTPRPTAVPTPKPTTPPAQTVPPTVAFTAPRAGATLKGDVYINAFASDRDAGTADGAGIESVTFQLIRNGEVIASRQENLQPFDWYFDTATVRNGSYTIKANVKSKPAAGGGTAAATRTVTIAN